MCVKVSTMNPGLKMKKQSKHTDEQLLEQIKQRVDGDERNRFFDDRLRNLSVDVLRARDSKRKGTFAIGSASLALGAVATAIILVVMDPLSSSDPMPMTNQPSTAVESTSLNTALATTYVDDLVEEESIELLAEAVDTDPLLLTDDDIDNLFEGL